MKSMLLPIIFLVIIIVGSTTTIFLIKTQSDSMHEQLVLLEKAVNDENWSQVEKYMGSFQSKWNKIHPIWSMLIDHYEIDYINMDLGELEAFIKTKDKTNSLAKANSLQLLIKHIPEKEYPLLRNIL